jgi:hypothetical protein
VAAANRRRSRGAALASRVVERDEKPGESPGLPQVFSPIE